MTDTTHLVMFLQARLTEDEANAKRAGGDRWIQDGGSIHRERHETAHVLADIAAKRRIIEWHSDNPHECEGPQGSEYVADDDSDPCSTMKALASVYADHPDYRKEWAAKPTSIHPLARPTDGNTT
ncbi:MAG TPA: DUF6221 family protein [Kribbellaceae bacterium]|nr:DUF6221 family protein [Kribbellaceae bacterium]